MKGVMNPRVPVPTKERLEALRKEGLSKDIIAIRFGVSARTVKEWLKRFGMPHREFAK